MNGTNSKRPPLSRRKKITLIAFGCAAPFIAALVLALLGEAACRMVMWFRHGVPGHSYGIYMADEELGATHRPNSYNSNSKINNWGFRNAEDIEEAKPRGTLRIYCSGGSTTFCYNLITEEAWPSLLQKELRRESGHEKDQVLNAGQIVLSVSQEYILARRFIPRLKPDYAVLFTGINEGLNARALVDEDKGRLDALQREGKWGVNGKRIGQARFWIRHSTLVRLWDYYVKKWFEKSATSEFRRDQAPENFQGWPDFHPWVLANQEHTLRDFLRYLRANGVRTIVVRYGDNGRKDWYLKEGIRIWRDKAVAIGREEGALICDFASIAEKHPRRMDLYMESGVHVTREGADLMAGEIKKTILADQAGMHSTSR
jgi:lysophospholipase L1-like esterase